MQIGYLGPLEVHDGAGARLDVPGPRLRALLTLLALDVGRTVPTGGLTDALWPEAGPTDPANALQSLVSRLRRALGDPALVRQLPGGYRLEVEPGAVDGERLGRLAAQGHDALAAGAPARAQELLEAALATWRGDPLPDLDGPDAHAARGRLHAVRERAELDRLTALLELGRWAEVLGPVEQLLRETPLREDLVALRLGALAGLGRPGDALAAYDALRRALADTLGTDPSARLQALHAELLGAGGPAVVPRTNLRAPVTSFVGREDDLVRVDALLVAGRLVTVLGTGGAGKTRLATEVAARRVAGTPDGVWFVDLAAVADPDGIALAVLDGLGVREVAQLEQRADRPRTTGRERAMTLLAASGALLVLDNCEHVVAAAADLVAELLGRCPALRVPATSREPLGVDGEQLHALAPLAAGPDRSSPAVRLLRDRAGAAGVVLGEDPATVAAVVEVVQRLDGLPLAIELAAARLRVLPVAELAERLSDRFRLLTGGRRTAVARHRTLRAVVEWSWELLTPDERTVAERFSVLGAGAGVDAVAAVCPGVDPAAVEDVLTALVDKSLLVVVPGPGVRFRMLETLREYGLERLVEHGTAEDVGRAHAEHFAVVAARADAALRTRDQLAALAVLDVERENVLQALAFHGDSGRADAALELVVHLAWFWLLRENGDDAVRALRHALGLPGAGAAPTHAFASALDVLLTAALEPEDRRRTAPPELRLAGQDHDPTGQLGPLLEPVLAFLGGDRERAALRLGQALAHPDAWVRACARQLRLFTADNDGDAELVRAEVGPVLEAWCELGDRWGIAAALVARAQVRTFDGDLAGAEADLTASVEHLRELGSSSDDLFATVRLVDLRLRTGDLDGARTFVERVREHRSTQDPRSSMGLLTDAVAGSLALAEAEVDGRTEGLAPALVAARDHLAQVDVEPTAVQAGAVCITLTVLVELQVRTGDLTAARASLCRAHELGLRTNDLPIISTVAVAAAVLALGLDRPRVAATALGLSDRLRGAADPTQRAPARIRAALDVRERDDPGIAEAYRSARGLDRPQAVEALDPDVLLA